jgi:hypothetical protein
LQNVAYTMPEMQRFVWHINTHFQVSGFKFRLSSKVGANEASGEPSYIFYHSFNIALQPRKRMMLGNR